MIESHVPGMGMPSSVEIIGDATLERGAVIFDTARGNLDASLSTQLQEIERGLIDLVRRNRDAV